ncbi:MAG: transposase [Nitrosospira sp.]|nr:transposase [Nitrosospira sp.]
MQLSGSALASTPPQVTWATVCRIVVTGANPNDAATWAGCSTRSWYRCPGWIGICAPMPAVPVRPREHNPRARLCTACSISQRRQTGFRHRWQAPARWIVEVAHSCFNRFRKLLVRYEKTDHAFLALDMLAAAIIRLRKIQLKPILFTDKF